ncbi:MAG: ribosome-binding factor A [Candidatus Pacebacteria bacterium]|nr:ribosome-binding factor A [Candidatus Paceibacterota bacterium]
MSILRQDKVKELIRNQAAQFLQEESNYTSLITVTDTSVSKDFKKATIFVTVYPETSEESVMNFLKRKRRDFKEFIKPKVKMKRIPFFDFEIDRGEKNRQRIDEISHKI